MSDSSEVQATCLCQAIRIVATPVREHMGACHCSMCRKWSGGPLLAVECRSDVKIEGEENITVFDSSAWAERGFCSTCGTHLFYRLKDSNQYIMPVGLFDNLAGVQFDHQIFIDEKPAYYHFGNETTYMTGADVFAKYAPSTD